MDLTAFNTLGLRSAASCYLRVDDLNQLPGLADAAERAGRLFVLGGGSNVVLPPQVAGLVAHVALRGIELSPVAGGVRVEAAAGETWHDLVRHCVERGLGGLENLALIPGTVGAAPVQNIGAYGVELKDRLHSLRAYDLRKRRWVEFDVADCGFAYRDSVFKRDPGRWLIASVRLTLPTAWRPVLDYPDLQRQAALAPVATPRAVFDAVCGIRRAKLPDPAVLGNAGSFFKNPIVPAAQYAELAARVDGLVAYAQPGGGAKLAAGWLIDRCGWKGRRMGPVGVHDRQALVIVNHGGATAADVLRLAAAIQGDVRQAFGVELEPEPVVVAGA